MVKVGLRTTSAGAMCIGAATTTDPDDDTPCDCFTSGACNVSAYPADPSEWRRVVPVGQPTLGNTDTDDDGVAVIDPKRGGLTQRTDAGGISLKAPIGGGVDYRLNMAVDGNGRAVLCEPAAAPTKLPEYSGRRC
jgi:hypothetical protein